ncbi:MAG: glutamate-1-semialdehyde 2,1-aminomutase [Planctomycetes bacterium]|nr:glutamate-1-semialdehyde 2,1-aminomutase [Planctomycetota bacterium]
MQESQSHNSYKKAQDFFPGGVNSPVRAFRNVNSTPFFIESAEGSQLTDLDGNKYIDYVLSWGPMALGHAHPEVKEAVIESLNRGWTYGAPCEGEIKLAEKVRSLIPSMEMMRFVSSGTEAAMGAIRLARGVTNRDIIVKCDGGYHGHSDGLLVSAGSGLATFGTSSSAGVPEQFAKTTLVIPMNDSPALEKVLQTYPDRIAAFILEPVAGNVGVIPPNQGYLEKCKQLCHQYGALIIFDEVMCGFRASLNGAQGLYNIIPDITVLGKVIGGGFPVGAYGASKELMKHIAPDGPIYQAGTLSGNPTAMAAGLKTLEVLEREGHSQAMKNTDILLDGIKEILNQKSLPHCLQRVGTMFSLFLCEGPVENYQDSSKTDGKVFAQFHRGLLENGVFFAPSPFEASFMSSAHSDQDLAQTLNAINAAINIIA